MNWLIAFWIQRWHWMTNGFGEVFFLQIFACVIRRWHSASLCLFVISPTHYRVLIMCITLNVLDKKSGLIFISLSLLLLFMFPIWTFRQWASPLIHGSHDRVLMFVRQYLSSDLILGESDWACWCSNDERISLIECPLRGGQSNGVSTKWVPLINMGKMDGFGKGQFDQGPNACHLPKWIAISATADAATLAFTPSLQIYSLKSFHLVDFTGKNCLYLGESAIVSHFSRANAFFLYLNVFASITHMGTMFDND